MRKLLALAVVMLAACNSGDGEPERSAPTTTEPAETTSTTADPDTAFLAEVDENTDGTLDEAGILAFGQSICDGLDPLPGPEVDEAIADQMDTMLLNVAMEEADDPAVAEVIMRAAGAELCPEHYSAIVTYLNS